MHHSGNSGNSITVEPGKAEQLIWSFHGDKNIELACNIPGHAEAGMTKNMTL
ncbi:putative Cupredoxin (fragment) [Vibrio aestuarianus]